MNDSNLGDTLVNDLLAVYNDYVDLYEEIYSNLKPDGYICEVASTIEEAKKLIEQGFEYVCEIEGEQLFRKVK